MCNKSASFEKKDSIISHQYTDTHKKELTDIDFPDTIIPDSKQNLDTFVSTFYLLIFLKQVKI